MSTCQAPSTQDHTEDLHLLVLNHGVSLDVKVSCNKLGWARAGLKRRPWHLQSPIQLSKGSCMRSEGDYFREHKMWSVLVGHLVSYKNTVDCVTYCGNTESIHARKATLR